jgi:hypothetical protein
VSLFTPQKKKKNQLAAASLRVSRENESTSAVDEVLYAACEQGNTENVVSALQSGANVNYVLPFWNHSVLHRSVFKRNADVVKILLFAGAHVDAVSADLSTPLHLAAAGGDVAMVELLLSFGARRDLLTLRKETPLSLAATEATRDALELRGIAFLPTRACFLRLPPGTRLRFRLVLLIHNQLRQQVGRTDSADEHGAWLRDVCFGDVPHWIVYDILAIVWQAEQELHMFGWQPVDYK